MYLCFSLWNSHSNFLSSTSQLDLCQPVLLKGCNPFSQLLSLNKHPFGSIISKISSCWVGHSHLVTRLGILLHASYLVIVFYHRLLQHPLLRKLVNTSSTYFIRNIFYLSCSVLLCNDLHNYGIILALQVLALQIADFHSQLMGPKNLSHIVNP